MLADELDMVDDPVGQVHDIVDALPEDVTWRELIDEIRGHHSLLKRLASAMAGPRYTTEEVWEYLREPRRDVPGLFT